MCSGVVLVANELKRRTAMEETNESRINIEDLPQAEQELTAEEAKEVKGRGPVRAQGVAIRNGAGVGLQDLTSPTAPKTYDAYMRVESIPGEG
jgi:carotenoid cleavage dioxygenase-like enzyme